MPAASRLPQSRRLRPQARVVANCCVAASRLPQSRRLRQAEPRLDYDFQLDRLKIAAVAATAAGRRFSLTPGDSCAASRLPQSRRLRLQGNAAMERGRLTASRLPQSRRLRHEKDLQSGIPYSAASRLPQSRRLRPVQRCCLGCDE